MPSISFQVHCAKCGEGLCNQTEVKDGRYEPQVHVQPCEKCLGVAREEGYDKGYSDGEESVEEVAE